MPAPPERGFTLIEIILVVTVIGLVALIAVPRIDVTRYRIRNGMQSISAELMTARRVAITKQHDVIVAFDLPGAALFVHDDINNNGSVDGGERRRRVPLGDAVVFGLGGASAHSLGSNPVNVVKRLGGEPVVVFHRGGSASETAAFYLTSIRAANNAGYSEDTRLIEIERATGRVSWYRYGSATWTREF